ncbi:MAG: hypothetical protein IJ300_02530 [Clostridia bacterium]|nr:hypothetical protein [Clostridia bacterium]
MKEFVSIIILFCFLRLVSYGGWTYKEKNNIIGSVGVGILCIGIIFMMATVIFNML